MQIFIQIIITLHCEPKSAKRVHISMQRIVNLELYDYSKAVFNVVHFEFMKEPDYSNHSRNVLKTFSDKHVIRDKNKNKTINF